MGEGFEVKTHFLEGDPRKRGEGPGMVMGKGERVSMCTLPRTVGSILRGLSETVQAAPPNRPTQGQGNRVFLHQVLSLISRGLFEGALTSVSVQPALVFWWLERDSQAETQVLGIGSPQRGAQRQSPEKKQMRLGMG